MNKPKIVYVSDTMCEARGKCVQTGELYVTAQFPAKAVHKYNAGVMLQDAFHMLSAGDREFILSGISPKGWNEMFSGEDEDESDL